MATSTDLRSAIEEVQGQLPAGQMPVEGELPLGEADWSTRMEHRVGALPWWVISAVTHAVVFLLIALLATAVAPSVTDEVVIATDVVRQKPPEYDPNRKRDIFKNPKEVQAETQVENPVVTHEKIEETDRFETDNQADKNSSRGQEDAISDIPLGGTGTVGSVGVGGGGMAGCFGYRDGGGRRKAVGRFGGSQATESAVEAALRWLARHQEADGHWAVDKWEGGGVVQGNMLNTARLKTNDISITGLATLAFLGAGYTHKQGQFKDNVQRAIAWLAAKQLPSGAFEIEGDGAGPRNGFQVYDHCIGTLALAEAYGMSKDEALRAPAQKGVDNLLRLQEPYGAWKHTAAKSTSVTGWAVMAMKSARIAGLRVEGAAFQGVTNWLDKVTVPSSGLVGYGARGQIFWGKGYVTTAVGMVCREFMGTPNTDALLLKQADLLLKEVPKWEATNHAAQTPQWPYYWYYGTLAMFQIGGDRWNKWNEALKRTLVPNQRKGGPMDGSAADKDGSWDCGMGFGPTGGRAYTTAVNALTLEVYYRYLPMYAK